MGEPPRLFPSSLVGGVRVGLVRECGGVATLGSFKAAIVGESSKKIAAGSSGDGCSGQDQEASSAKWS